MPIQPKRTEVRYKDFKVNFTEHPIKRDLVLDTDSEAVKRSIKNLMFTDRYERPWQPKLGAGLKAYLFENIEYSTASTIRKRIISTIQTYEPRAKLQEVIVSVDADNNRYNAKIVFSVLNNPEPVTIETILERKR